ncbi:hypothetical protein IWX49DRAFT_551547 [Phyllosticta citricarpa]|uniref:BTB domain-containing protein n=2 Tax=Phyllosticta TaxID=121621 RepID=A0ABR1MDJ2_9PEZI
MSTSHGQSLPEEMMDYTPAEPSVPRDTRSPQVQSEPPPPVRGASQANQHASTPRRPTFHELHQTPIRILVAEDGVNGQSFFTHEELLAYHSRFFQRQFALKRPDQTHHILEDVHPHEFAIFYRWMESKQLFESDDDRKEWKMCSLATLHETAMRIEAPMFANVIMEAIHSRVIMLTQTNAANRARKFDSSLKTINWIANNVPLTCCLYQYARDYMAYFYMLHVPELKCEVLVELPGIFIYNLLQCLRDGIARLSPITGNRIDTKDVVRPRDIEPFKKHFVDLVMVLAGGLQGLIKAHPNTKYAHADTICDYHVHERQDPPSKKCRKKLQVGFWEDASALLLKNQTQVIE